MKFVESPKLRNFKKAAFVIFTYSLILTAGISFLAVLLILALVDYWLVLPPSMRFAGAGVLALLIVIGTMVNQGVSAAKDDRPVAARVLRGQRGQHCEWAGAAVRG